MEEEALNVEPFVYVVVFRNRGGRCAGALTWSLFPSKSAFHEWYNDEMALWFEVEAEGITERAAKDMCRTIDSEITVTAALRLGVPPDQAAGLLNCCP